jgi:hypothetical protein
MEKAKASLFTTCRLIPLPRLPMEVVSHYGFRAKGLRERTKYAPIAPSGARRRNTGCVRYRFQLGPFKLHPRNVL